MRLVIEPELNSAFDEVRGVLRELDAHHQHVADATDLDLVPDPGSRPLALWETSAAALGLANALVGLAALGYHAQLLPTYRALSEMLGVISVLDDENEGEFLSGWLANEQVRQREVRDAASRQSGRIPDHTKDAGEIMKRIYSPLSDSSHGRRERVRDYISPSLRAAVTGPHPSWYHRLVFDEVCIALMVQAVMVVGGALDTLYGGRFYNENITPLVDRLEAVAARLEAVEQGL